MSDGAFYLIKTRDEWQRYRGGFETALAFLLETGPVWIKLGRYDHPKSRSQENMWRGLCRDIAEFWNANKAGKIRDQYGDFFPPTTPDAVARDLKLQFGVILTEWSPVTGKRSARFKSTAVYSDVEMSSLITATLAWAADEGIPLPDPRGE